MDPITVASRVATLLETGARTATYKLATMTAASAGIYAALPHGSLPWRAKNEYEEHK